MASRHLTAKGNHIDMDKLRAIHATKPALGNANKNARGDMLGPGGKILKTQEQIQAEMAAAKNARTASVRSVDIKGPSLIPDSTPVAVLPKEELDFNNKEFDSVPPVEKPVSRRKIIETNE